MKTHGLKDLLGKRIAGVVAKRSIGHHRPAGQVFLIFDDGTYFEFWGDFSPAGGVDPGGIEAVRQYLAKSTEIVYEAFLDADNSD